jgi:regulatory protein
MARQPLSLRARAVTLLAQRDHSELELRRKLGRIARQAAEAQASATEASTSTSTSTSAWRSTAPARFFDDTVEGDADDSASANVTSVDLTSADTSADISQQVDDVLVWLRQQGYLDESRFVESRLHARSSRWGQRRIEQELAQHGLSLDAEQRSSLADTELERACELLRRKFSVAAAQDPTQDARQMRFLLGRGFQSDVARRAIRSVKSEGEPD